MLIILDLHAFMREFVLRIFYVLRNLPMHYIDPNWRNQIILGHILVLINEKLNKNYRK